MTCELQGGVRPYIHRELLPQETRESLFHPVVGGFLSQQVSLQYLKHRLNMDVDLQSLLGFHVTWCAHLYSLAVTLQLPPFPRNWTRITWALLVNNDRRHLFVTPWCKGLLHWFVFPGSGSREQRNSPKLTNKHDLRRSFKKAFVPRKILDIFS